MCPHLNWHSHATWPDQKWPLKENSSTEETLKETWKDTRDTGEIKKKQTNKTKTDKRASLCVRKQASKKALLLVLEGYKREPQAVTWISNDITFPGSNPVDVPFTGDATSLNKLYYLPGSYFACIPGASYIHSSSVFWAPWLQQYTAMHWSSPRLSRHC